MSVPTHTDSDRLVSFQRHALEQIEDVLLSALGRDPVDAPVFTPRNVVALAYEAAAVLREARD